LTRGIEISIDEPHERGEGTYNLDLAEAQELATALRAIETPHAPELEGAARSAAVILEPLIADTYADSPSFTREEGHALYIALERESTRGHGLSTRLTRLRRALREKFH
jgi:hypothetical protein